MLIASAPATLRRVSVASCGGCFGQGQIARPGAIVQVLDYCCSGPGRLPDVTLADAWAATRGAAGRTSGGHIVVPPERYCVTTA